MTMFPIHIHEEGKPLPEDPICYIIAKEGIYLKKNLGIMNSLAKVDNISILASVETSASMNVPKIPAKLIARTFAFFREVYKEHSAEAVVILFYNPEKKQYKIIPPLQKVAGSGLEYDRNITCEGYDKIGSIHSHANFSAFHSGVDDSDEWSFDGLHLTFGHCGCTDGIYTIAASICSNKQRFVVEPLDYISGVIPAAQIPKPVTTPAPQPAVETFRSYGPKHYRWENGQLVEFNPYQQTGGGYLYQSASTTAYDKKYGLLVKELKFPKDWMKLVEKRTYTYVTPAYNRGVGRFDWEEYYAGGGGGMGYDWYNHVPGAVGHQNWRHNGYHQAHVDPDAWKNNRHVVVKNGKVCIVPGTNPKLPPPTPPGVPIQNVGVKVKPIEFPPHTLDDDDLFPCKHCVFRDTKIEWAIEMYTEEIEDDVPASKEVDNYRPDPRTFKDVQRAEGEGMPIVINGPDPNAEMYFCMECKRSTWVDPKDKADCLICQSPMIKIENRYEGYNKESEIHSQASADSGALLIPNGDEFEKAVKEAAKAADREKVFLPVPGKESVPLGVPPKARFSVRKLLQICRGKK
jgi:hypothetical protein